MNDIARPHLPSLTGPALLFVAGLVAAQQLSELPTTAVIFIGGGLVLLLTSRMRALAWLLMGFFWAAGYGAIRLADALPPSLEGRDLIVEGHILDLPEHGDDGLRFEFHVDTVLSPPQARIPEHVRLGWYRSRHTMSAGERWRLTVRLKRPHGFMNPGGLDYEQWLFAQGIRATGYVRDSLDNSRLADADGSITPLAWRQRLHDGLAAALVGSQFGGIIQALTMGVEDDIAPEQWEVLRKTGTAHLVAISGSHIGLIAGFAFVAARRTCALFGPVRWPPPRMAAIAATVVALLYSALADFAIPTRRALIMIAIVMGGVLIQRHVRPMHSLLLALLAVTAYDPLAVLAPGFWLSFAAVGLIVMTVAYRLRPPGWWRGMWEINWVTAFGLAPLLLLFFQQISVISPIANLIAVPTIGLIAIPLCLLGALVLVIYPAGGAWLLGLVDGLLRLVWAILQHLSALPFAQFVHPTPPAWTLVFAIPGVLLLVAPRGIPARWLGAVLLLPALGRAPDRPMPGDVHLSLLDVGQGLAAVVQTRAHTLVFDTGARFNSGFDIGSAVIEPFLRHAGTARIDALIVSHGDNDHIGGAASLLKAFPVSRIYTSVPAMLASASPRLCEAGQTWFWDGVRFDMLSPFGTAGNENDNSCVLKVGTRNGSVLLTGDIEGAAERRLVARYGSGLASTILVAPHHGSNTSSTETFLAATRPRYVLVSAGYLNRYGFPHPKVLQRYRAVSAEVVDTAQAGAITVDTGQGVAEPRSFRQTNRKYWHSPE